MLHLGYHEMDMVVSGEVGEEMVDLEAMIETIEAKDDMELGDEEE